MIKINIHDAKTHLSRYLKRVAEGETVVLCRRNVPIAEIRPLPQPPGQPRALGLDAGRFTVQAEFFDPLPDDLLEGFEVRST